MTERDLLHDSVDSLLSARCTTAVVAAARDGWSADVWEQLERAGIPLAAVPEPHGGAGGTLRDAAVAVRLAGYHGVPAPLAETALIGGPLLAMAGIDVPSGPLSVALHPSSRVPYGRVARGVVALAGTDVVLLDPSTATIDPSVNLAGEPRDALHWDALATPIACVPAPPGVDADWLLRRGALARSLQLAGALQRVAELGLDYAAQREQFGRPLAKFQVIQHQLAAVAEDVCAAAAAATLAVECCGDDAVEEWAIAAAKVRTGQAAGRVAAAVHQLHGAIGVTEEHPLRLFTTRLWSWRDEFGDEALWSLRLGRLAAAAGPSGLWPALTRTAG